MKSKILIKCHKCHKCHKCQTNLVRKIFHRFLAFFRLRIIQIEKIGPKNIYIYIFFSRPEHEK